MHQEHLESGNISVETGTGDWQADHDQALSPQQRPQGEMENIIAAVVAEVIGVRAVPRMASLFDLGLDSLSVTVACARLEQATGVVVRFSQLFRTPTIELLAAWIDTAREKLNANHSSAAKTARRSTAELVAITPVQAENVRAGTIVKVAWWFDAALDEVALESAVNDIHRRHQALHAKYLDGADLGLAEVPADPEDVQFHLLGQEADDAAASEVFWRTLRNPLRLGEGVVWRCALVRSAQTGRTLFGLAVDHTGFDGRSWDILTAELPPAYAARVAGTAPQWPGRTASLAEMAADFRHQVASADAEAQRRYWQGELSDLPACGLPRRADAPEIPATGKTVWSPPGPATMRSIFVSQSQLRSWEAYARANGMATSVGMAAAYVAAIIRAGAPRDFGLEVSIANLAGETIDRTITNRVADVVLRPNGPSRSGHIIARMRDVYHQGMAARDILVDPRELGRLHSGREGGGIPLYKLAAMLYNSVPDLSLGGVPGTLTSEGGGERRIPFAVMLQIVPVPEGLDIALSVRTDMYDAAVADDIRQHFLDIIADGPERLELEDLGDPVGE
jgi:aryl carrier-like protein